MRLPVKALEELKREMRRSELLRYAHRVHAVLLIAKGWTYPAAADLLLESQRTIASWVRRYEEKGLDGLHEGPRPGRPRGLTEAQVHDLANTVQQSPTKAGFDQDRWTGKILVAWIERQYAIHLGARHCRRLLRNLRG